MSFRRNIASPFVAALALALVTSVAQASPHEKPRPAAAMSASVPGWLVGTWKLVRCDNVYSDGRRMELYGRDPQGRWMIDAQGHYMMMIARAKRTPFASDDKSTGTPAEYRAASLDVNAHYGNVAVKGDEIMTHIEQASFPNWIGHSGMRYYTRDGDRLTYIVARPTSGASAGAHGEVVWQRIR